MEHLGALPGGNHSYAFGVNSSGIVVGHSQSTAGKRAFRWDSANGMSELSGLFGGYGFEAMAINNAGSIAGSAADAFNYRAVLWDSSGGVHDLGFLAGTQGGYAQSLNDVGQVVGYCLYPTTAFIWDATNGMRFIYGPPTANVESVAYDINNSGLTVGYVADHSDARAFAWTESGGISWIGDLGGDNPTSYGFSVNDTGMVVGHSASSFDSKAFIWSASSGIKDLNSMIDASTPGWELRSARGINNAGQITGYGSINGVNHAFLATPVPELGSNSTLLVGLLTLLAGKRKSVLRA